MNTPNPIDHAYQLFRQGDLAQSKKLCEQELTKQPDNPVLRQLYPIVLFKLGFTKLAYEQLSQQVAKDPKIAESRFSLGLMQLWYGDFAEGWQSYEYRFQISSFNFPNVQIPRWTGEHIADKHLLVSCEQGYGDCIQFFRFLRMAKQRCRKLTIACFPPLTPLFKQAPFVDEIVERIEQTGHYDRFIGIASLPMIFAANPYSIPKAYDFSHLPVTENLSSQTIDPNYFNIGIAWAGNNTHENDFFRSITLDFYWPLLDIDNSIRLVTIQPHKTLQERSGFVQAGRAIKNFADTTQLLRKLDLIISVDTSVAHLALSLGKPTWVILSEPREWRWQIYHEQCPWYPEARLIPQAKPGDWDSVQSAVVKQLRAIKGK